MKLKKYKEIFEQDVTLKGYNSDEADDDLFGRPNYQTKDKEKSEKDEKNVEFGSTYCELLPSYFLRPHQ